MEEAEKVFIHDLNNKLAIVFGGVMRIARQPDKFSKEEIVEIAKKSEAELQKALDLIEKRVSDHN